MAWISYKDWLAKNKLSSSAGNAANWERQYGPNGYQPKPAAAQPAAPQQEAPAQQAPAAAYSPPLFDPNYQDAEAQSALSLNKAKYDTQRVNAQSSYARYLTQTYGDGAATATKDASGKITGYTYDLTKRGGQFARIQQGEDQNLRKAVNNAAARGVFRSGIRLKNEGLVRTDAANQRTDIENQRQNAQGEMDSSVTGANTDETFSNSQVTTDANRRRVDKYNRDFGMGS
jgi:hypothetical protein